MTKRHGFSLLELLTVLAVLSVVSTIGMTAFFKITDYWQVTTLRQEMNARSQAAFTSIRDDLGTVLSQELSGYGLEGVARLEEEQRYGRVPLEDDMFSLPVRYINPLTGTPVHRRVRYSIDRSGGTTRLVRQEGALTGDNPNTQETTVAEGVLSMRCSYFDGTAWHKEWDEDALPLALRVSLVMRDSTRAWEQIARQQVFTVKVAGS